MTTRLTPHFTLEELTHSQQAVRAGIYNTPDVPAILENLSRIAELLEEVRTHLGDQPILISSGYRSTKFNTLIGGSRSSQHCIGLAVDFTCPGFGSPREICETLIKRGLHFDQLIYEGTWVHLSLSGGGLPLRNEVLTAVFEPGKPIRYLKGVA